MTCHKYDAHYNPNQVFIIIVLCLTYNQDINSLIKIHIWNLFENSLYKGSLGYITLHTKYFNKICV